MPLRLSTANQCRRADGPASIGTCENSGSPPPPALARSPRIAPAPAHSLPPHAHAAARNCMAPCSLHFATSLLPASHATLRAHFEGESRRGHDPDKVRTGVSCPSRGRRTAEPGSRAGRDEFRPPLRLESQRTGLKTGHYTGEPHADTLRRLETAVRVHRFGEFAQTHARG